MRTELYPIEILFGIIMLVVWLINNHKTKEEESIVDTSEEELTDLDLIAYEAFSTREY